MNIKLKVSAITGLLIAVCLLQTSSSINNQYATSYFPVVENDNYKQGITVFENSWFSKHLASMKEPVLWGSIYNKQIYRLLYLPTFCNPVIIRIEINPDLKTGILYCKKTDGYGGYNAGNITVNEQKVLSIEQVKLFLKTIEEQKFWSLPIKDSKMGCDGNRWIIEGTVYGMYHVVNRWEPDPGTPFDMIATLFWDLTK